MNRQPLTDADFEEIRKAVRATLGEIIADQRAEWRRERRIIEAEGRQAIAELRAEFAERLAALLAGRPVDLVGKTENGPIGAFGGGLPAAGAIAEADPAPAEKPRHRVPANSRRAGHELAA